MNTVHRKVFLEKCERIVMFIANDNRWRDDRGYERIWFNVHELARATGYSGRQVHRYCAAMVAAGWLERRIGREGFGFWYWFEFRVPDALDPRLL